MAKYKRKRKTSRKYRRKSPARRKKRKRVTSKRPNRRRRAAKRIQRTYRRYKKRTRRTRRVSSWKRKVNLVAKRVNTYLEPRVIRHGWTPTIGGGLGCVATDDDPYNLPGINPVTGIPGILNWMVDVSTAPGYPNMAILEPAKRHNPLLFMRVSTANDINVNPNPDINPPAAGYNYGYPTCQPRTGQANQQQGIPPGLVGFVGGAWIGGYDSFEHNYYRPATMMNTSRLFQSNEDCIAYKEFPFIPRVEKDFESEKFNGSSDTSVVNLANPPQTIGNTVVGNIANMSNTSYQATTYQRLHKWETRDGDKILVRNNYHNFDIQCFPDLEVTVPVAKVRPRMPGLPKEYAKGGQLDAELSELTTNTSDTVANVIAGPQGTPQTTGTVQAWATKQLQEWPGYVTKKPKWFAKVRFLVVRRQRKFHEEAIQPGSTPPSKNRALKFIGCRQSVGNNGVFPPPNPLQLHFPGEGDFLYSLKDYFQEHCLSTNMAAPDIVNRGEYLNYPEPGRAVPPSPAPGPPPVVGQDYAYKPAYLFDKRYQATEVWKATFNRADKDYKSKISGLINQTKPEADLTMSNPKDPTLKIMYDKTIICKGKKRNYTHIMNTMKNKVIEYLKERQENQTSAPTENQDSVDQEATQNPLEHEYRFWVVVHAHNCQVQIKADHVFKFDA